MLALSVSTVRKYLSSAELYEVEYCVVWLLRVGVLPVAKPRFVLVYTVVPFAVTTSVPRASPEWLLEYTKKLLAFEVARYT